MEPEFTINDVFDMAVKIEQDACTFYNNAALVCRDGKVREAFMYLASIEQEHELVFQGLRELTGDLPERALDVEGIKFTTDEASVLLTFTSSGIGSHLAESFTGRESSEEVLKKAIDFEKDTIVFFLTTKQMLGDSPARERVDSLIKEELGHVITLTCLLTSAGKFRGLKPSTGVSDEPGQLPDLRH